MIDVYAFATPNSLKVPIALEELGLEYTLNPVNVRQDEQKTEQFLALNPNAKVPVLVDYDGPAGPVTITESAAILVYLAEKTGRLLARDGVERVRVFEQLFFHASALSPSFGQSGYFQRSAPEQIPLAIARFHGEAERTTGVLDGVLASNPFAAGAEFSIADIAHFGWFWRREFAGIDLSKFPNVQRWYGGIAARPAVERAIARITALAA